MERIVTPLYALAFLSDVLALGWMSPLPSFAVCIAGSAAVLAGLRMLVRRRTQALLLLWVILMGGVLLKRRVRPFQSLSLALTAVLLFDLFAVQNAGFWLSFAAVGFILHAFVGRRHAASPFAWKDWGRVQ